MCVANNARRAAPVAKQPAEAAPPSGILAFLETTVMPITLLLTSPPLCLLLAFVSHSPELESPTITGVADYVAKVRLTGTVLHSNAPFLQWWMHLHR